MERFDSPYYPPRARFGSSCRRFSLSLLHRIGMGGSRGFRSAANLLIPGLGLYTRHGNARWAFAVFVAWLACLALAVFSWLRFHADPHAVYLCLAVALHGISLGSYLSSWTCLSPTGSLSAHRLTFHAARFGMTVLFVLVLGFFVYRPAIHLASAIIMPLRTPQGIVIVNGLTRLHRLQRGDLVAWRVERLHIRTGVPLYVRDGIGCDPVLGLPGDRIRFHPDQIEINGILQPAAPNMPQSGEHIVPKDCWFIWPSSLQVRGPRPEMAGELAMRLAFVPGNRIMGRPFSASATVASDPSLHPQP